MDKKVAKISSWLGSGSINIFGLPFAGKDTQAHRLADLLGASVIAGGDILRSHSDQEKIKELMASGELFPTDYYLGIVIPFLSQPSLADKPLILSSLGRWHGEEESILKATAESGHPLKAVVFLELSETEIWKRFEAADQQKDRGFRHDDAKHVLETRLKEFHAKTSPVIDFYRAKNLLISVNGAQNPEAVTEEIIDSLVSYTDL
jgi:adenylate kinase